MRGWGKIDPVTSDEKVGYICQWVGLNFDLCLYRKALMERRAVSATMQDQLVVAMERLRPVLAVKVRFRTSVPLLSRRRSHLLENKSGFYENEGESL